MGFLRLYLISVLFSFTPYMINRTATQIKLAKEGYNFNTKNFSFGDDMRDVLSHFLISLVPGLNILKGVGGIIDLLHFKQAYAYKKLGFLLNGGIYLEKEHSDLDEIQELVNTLGNMVDVPEENKRNVNKAFEAIRMYDYLTKNGYIFNEDFDNLELDDAYDYLKKATEEMKAKKDAVNIKNASDKKDTHSVTKSNKTFDQMTRREKLAYLKKQKEAALRDRSDIDDFFQSKNTYTRKKKK